MDNKEFNQFIKDTIKDHPHLKDEIDELYDLAMYEIEEGGSPWHEMTMCKESINELIQEQL